MIVFIGLTLFFTLIYFIILVILSIHWHKIKQAPALSHSNRIGVSVIIPFRNEQSNLNNCINSIRNQHYPHDLVEIILVDDHSTDESLNSLSEIENINIIQLPKHLEGKKAALEVGINAAKFEWIVTRDADTICSSDWLSNLMILQEHTNADFIIGQVAYTGNGSFLSAIQILENMAISIVGGGMARLGKPILCNGANLLFRKSGFIELNGYAGNEKIASGDDIFLLNKFQATKKKVSYCRNFNSIVYCKTEEKFWAYFNQRIRWAGKNKQNSNPFNFLLAFLIFTTNCLVFISLFFTLLANDQTIYFSIVVLMKFIVDGIILAQSAFYFKQVKLLCWMPLFFCVYPLLILFVLSLSLFHKASWKGRKIN